ncbi:MAG: hypothetical protein V5B34_16810 [Accumulibacter sp.]|jgi:hypothetical protein|uniref:hypothetical protein n=1 Tax=Accumulibacter sp. TaxID=2053492 RepID=UPI002FC2E50E
MWVKRGLIFQPSKYRLPFENVGFAQSPQALVLHDRIRVYFSTRERDASGKFLSHVAFVDFDRRLEQLLGVSTSPVIPLGGLGCFDEHGIFPFHVFDDGNRILAYTTGWNRKVSVSADAAIGLAISADDGVTFQRHGTGPILAATLHEPFLVGDAFVTKHEFTYHMWYIFGLRWIREDASAPPDRVYKIAHAVSQDGITWHRNSRQVVPDRLNADECQALPTVISIDGTYHMYFCYREAHGFRNHTSATYRIGYAWSTDLIHWQRDDTRAGIDLSAGNCWDSQMQCYPHVFACDGRVHLLYNGNEFGRHGFGHATLEH